MPGFFSNPFGSRSSEDLPTIEPVVQNVERRSSMDEQLDWHETIMFGAAEEPQRLRRASSFGDISAYANMAPAPTQPDAPEATTDRPAFRYRTPSVVAARQEGLGYTRQRQGSVMGDRRGSIASRRTSIYDRNGSVQSGRRPSLATSGPESRGRQPSVAWARQSSVIDRQLANMTWSDAERLMSLDDNFYDAIGDATQGRRVSLLGDKLKGMREKEQEKKPGVTTIDIGTTDYPTITDPKDPRKDLSKKSMRSQKLGLMLLIVGLNAGMLFGSIFGGGPAGHFVLAFILFTKSKDFLSVMVALFYLPLRMIYRLIKPPPPVKPSWILTFIPAYSESEEQIIKAIRSLRNNQVEPHQQVMVVMLDGKARDVKSHMRILKSFRRPYVTFRWKRGELLIDAGWVDDTPVIVFEKLKNAGKKDSLILAFDLFNALRDNAPLYTRLLREEIWKKILPALTAGKDVPFEKFDMVFCTDADSTIYPGCLRKLADALLRDPKAIAACGSVLVETTKKNHWHFWQLYQQFQYCFGQFVRRRSESIWGKVTCLPGCVTMIRVRDEMKGAVRKYAEAITKTPVVHHQVQYLGTDRRLTYCMLSQDKKLHTIFVPDAVSLTEAPVSLKHYLSQRRRWGSNSYFNDWFYCFGEKMIIVTRIEAFIEVIRLSMVYYRIANTLMFLYGLASAKFNIVQLAPVLAVGLTPTAWFIVNIIIVRELRIRAHRLFCAFFLNHAISPFLSMTIFYKVLRNLGSQVWGMTGGAAGVAAAAQAQAAVVTTTQNGVEKKVEVLAGGKEVADRIALGSIAAASMSEKTNLDAVTEEDETDPLAKPSAPPAPNIEAAATATASNPFGLNTSFSFGGPSGGSETPDNPFGDQAAADFSAFPGNPQSFSGASWKRRRSSTLAPTDTRRRMSAVATTPMVKEEGEDDGAPGASSVRASMPKRLHRVGSAASRSSRGKVSVVSVPGIVEESEDTTEMASQLFSKSPGQSRRVSVSSAGSHEPGSPTRRRASVSPTGPTWNSSFGMGSFGDKKNDKTSPQGSPTASTFPQRRISVSTGFDPATDLEIVASPTVRRASVVRLGSSANGSSANISKPRQRSSPEPIFAGRRVSVSTALEAEGSGPISPTLRRTPGSPKGVRATPAWSFGPTLGAGLSVSSPLRTSFSPEDDFGPTAAGSRVDRRMSMTPTSPKRAHGWSLDKVLDDTDRHTLPSPTAKEFT